MAIAKTAGGKSNLRATEIERNVFQQRFPVYLADLIRCRAPPGLHRSRKLVSFHAHEPIAISTIVPPTNYYVLEKKKKKTITRTLKRSRECAAVYADGVKTITHANETIVQTKRNDNFLLSSTVSTLTHHRTLIILFFLQKNNTYCQLLTRES